MASAKVVMTGCPVRTDRGLLGIPTVVLVEGQKRTLYDVGTYATRHQLAEGLAGYGLTTADIDRVVLSHLHWDHALYLEPFSKAEILVSERDYEQADSDESRDDGTPSFMTGMLAKYRVTLVKGDQELEKGLRLIQVPGHTAGFLAMEIEGEKGLDVVAGDAIPHACCLVAGRHERGWYSQESADEGMKMLAGRGGTIYPAHDRPFTYEGNEVSYVDGYEITLKCRFDTTGIFTLVKVTAP